MRIPKAGPFALASVVLTLASCSSNDADPRETPSAPPPSTCASPAAEEAALPPPALHTPRWAFEPWISKDISNRDDTYAFVDGFRERGIPVGAVVLDSPWETNYNTFVPNPPRYGDFPGLVRDMHDRGVRVVLWITSAVNVQSFDFEAGGGDVYPGESPNLAEGLACGYFVDEGEYFGWWKGRGAFVDFFDPRARTWWHKQQDPVLDLGIDGWKLDFAESYIPKTSLKTDDGEKSLQAYSEKYYEDFLAYGQQKRGRDFVTMVRAWDASYEFAGRFFARREHAPVAWMGDNRRDWVGLADALDHMFVSARAGYPMLGSDVGGYLDVDDKNLLGPKLPFDTLNFARWTAVGALSPFFQLHGRANLTPWTVPDHVDETIALYKYWARLHHALVPFLYSRTEEAWSSGKSLVEPIGEAGSWPGDYRYILGDAFLVAPLLDATGERAIPLPPGGRWYDWWTTAVAEGGATASADFANDRTKAPLYVREGTIVPMAVDDADDVLGLGGANAKGAWTVNVWPSTAESAFALREDDDSVTTIRARDLGTSVEIAMSAAKKDVVLRVRLEAAPTAVTVDGAASTPHASEALIPLEGSGWAYDTARKILVVRTSSQGRSAIEAAITK